MLNTIKVFFFFFQSKSPPCVLVFSASPSSDSGSQALSICGSTILNTWPPGYLGGHLNSIQLEGEKHTEDCMRTFLCNRSGNDTPLSSRYKSIT